MEEMHWFGRDPNLEVTGELQDKSNFQRPAIRLDGMLNTGSGFVPEKSWGRVDTGINGINNVASGSFLDASERGSK